MKIVMFKKDEKKILHTFENVNNVYATDNGVKWNDGELSGINESISIVEDDFEVIDTDLLPVFDKSQYKSPDQQLRDENASLNLQIIDLWETLINAGVL